jgi:hypothetical protein
VSERPVGRLAAAKGALSSVVRGLSRTWHAMLEAPTVMSREVQPSRYLAPDGRTRRDWPAGVEEEEGARWRVRGDRRGTDDPS